jgi:hypothetical protein
MHAHDDETPDEPFAAALHERQLSQIAPPPALIPVSQRWGYAGPQEEVYFHPSWTNRGNALGAILAPCGTTPRAAA